MNYKEICLKLIAAESEKNIDEIISSESEFSNSANWKPLDGRETNFNVTGNQASDGGKALTELMTNMVDAVLLKHAQIKGIDPKSDQAPQTMYQAVDDLIKDMRGGKLVNLDARDPWLKDFAQKNLVIGITGAKTKRQGLPCYTFVDNGEGQHPQNFEDTFLSLSAGNKKSIPFVQGKFNMGSSGVLSYCGRNWYKLIVSRKHDGSGNWGWTLMRRRPGNRNDMPIAEFFVGNDEQIPSFKAEELYPFNTIKGDRYDGVHIKGGCIIKLYDYQVGSQFLSFRGSRESLNENLIETILPFRILDLRQTPDLKRGGDRAKGVDPRPFYGMEFLLLNSHKEDEADKEEEAAGERKLFVGSFSDPNLGEVSVSAIHLKRDLPGWLKPPKNNSRVFHSVNGQVQFKQSRGYLSQSCGFPALKDRVVLVVDASNLSFAGHNEVWKGDREHIRNTVDGETYRELVTKTIKESDTLKDLQQRVAQEELEKAATAESNSLFQKLVDQDANLAGLLSSRDPSIRLPSAGGDTGGGEGGPRDWKDGKFSPTFVRLEEKFSAKVLEIPENLTRPIVARTDAENGYLQRADYKGRIVLTDDARMLFGVREHLKDGRLTIYLTPAKEKLTIGDTVSFKIELFDEAMPEPVSTEEVTIRVVEPKKESEPNPNPNPNPKPGGGKGGNKSGEGEPAPTHGLPKCVLLTRDGRDIEGYGVEKWPEDFTDKDGGMIAELGEEEGVVYKINYDNAYHLKYRTQQRGNVARDVVTEKYILGMRIMLLGYQHAFASQQSTTDDEEGGVAEYADEFRRVAARASASTVLALAENLPKIVDATSISEEDVE